MKKKPMISIIIPVYNGSNYIRQAIESALNQDYENYEIIVINDGSTDKNKTRKICLEYNDKIRYYEKENGGVSSALNLGISKMKGEYFSWLSHDDLYMKNKLSIQIKELQHHDNNTILYSNYSIVDENDVFIRDVILNSDEYNKKPLYSIFNMDINGITLLIPKKAFDECGNFDESLRCVQDYELWYKMMKKYKFYHMKEILGSTRVHSKQVSNTSPRVISEGNWFYKKIVDELDRKLKIEYEGTEYRFLDVVENKLRYRSKYIEAANYISNKKQKLLDGCKIDFNKISVCYIVNGSENKIKKQLSTINYPNVDIKIVGENKKIDVSNYDYIYIGCNNIDVCKFIKLLEVSNSDIIYDYCLDTRNIIFLDKFSKFLHADLNNLFIRNNKYKEIDISNLFDIALNCVLNGQSCLNNYSNIKSSIKFNEARKLFNNNIINKLNDESYANLCYQMAVLYNKNHKSKIIFYEECEKYKALSYSRAWQLYKKILTFFKKGEK